MRETEIFLGLLLVMVFLTALARRLSIAYPILLVLAGLGLSLFPGLPKIELTPDLVFILFLPPILQMAGWNTTVRDFRANLRSIGLLAIGLVLATMAVVAVVIHALIPEMPWAAAFVLGAIVAPPDAAAASAIASRLNLPRRVVTVLEGESMLNDATSLVAYRVALAAVITGAFSWWDAGGQFILSAVGGVVIGLLIGWAGYPIFRALVKDAPVYIILTFLSGYAAYLLADTLHVSGVLATVSLGIFYTRVNTMTPELRLQATPVWEIVVFLLNGFLFILIGLQLRGITERLDGETWTLIGYAAAVCLTVIVVRIVWVFPGTYLPRLPKKVRQRDPFPPWQHATIVAWTGMRGVVSLASALALPETIAAGQPFPYRDLIIFLTFCVILVTLVFQGLTLPFIIKWLKVEDDGGGEREEHKARLKAAKAAQDRLTELAQNDGVSEELVRKLAHQYEARVRRFAARYEGREDGETEAHFNQYAELEQNLIEAEMTALVDLRDQGVINDETMRRVQFDLDLEWLRMRDN